MKKLLCCAVVALLMLLVYSPDPARAESKELLGAGATFPYPLYSKMFDTYYQANKVKINYQAIGSGGGIQQLLSKTVDFGGTDAFLNTREIQKAEVPILHIPTCLGAVVVTYNLPEKPQLRFTPDVIADIFLGKITRWDDPRIAAINPAVKLPGMSIVVVHRSDGSGTTFIFSDYLTKVSKDWAFKVGADKSLNWPVGLGAKGNPGVAGLINQTPGAIGYVELIYTMQNNMPAGIVKNKAGNFIEPNIKSTSAAANIDMPDDTRVSLTDTDAADGYPISGFTWLILYKEQNYSSDRSKERAEELVKLLWWMLHEGQQIAEPMKYAPIPNSAITKGEKILQSVVYNGAPLLKQ
ncbi:MAG: phosphate ABC transporter substrate-binding protein PstS [Proteobacteria bacterium]|nr:phosphate ABC transporter substrate-binding protein PstS [Pseudomonadota bacterium]